MFVQVISGRVADRESYEVEGARWDEELRPGATGYLGSTGGITPDGRFIEIVRFDSAEAAQANSGRPEQGDWWQQFAKTLDGDANFAEYTEVVELLGGGTDDAGFVQVISGRATDVERARRQAATDSERLRRLRPDLLGALAYLAPDGRFHQANYFTSEADARQAEAAMADAPEAAEMMKEFETLFVDREFFDLPTPRLVSA